ncbi:Ppx/GppA phosphatase family protein [Natronospora cellulosivora (SeqCode)]
MRLGSIDVGTNSCRMLLVDYVGDEAKIIKKSLEITRLGEGVDNNLALTKDAIERTYKAIAKFIQDINDLKVRKVRVIGTSALRDVKNAGELTEKIKEDFNVDFDVISGDEEARLNYMANKNMGLDNMIIDIGGGSTEFIWKEGDEIRFNSLDMGSVRMTERFIKDPSNKISEIDLDSIKINVKEIMEKNLNLKKGIEKLIGLGGTITTLAAIDLAMEEYDAKKIEAYELSRANIIEILSSLVNKNLAERKKISGLQPGRADVIIAGTVVLLTIMDIMRINHIISSEYDLLYGVIEDMRIKA